MALLSWLKSFWSPQVVAVLPSAYTPGLCVVQRSGRLRLDAPHANYSYGELQNLWREVLDESGAHAISVQRALVLGMGAGGVLREIHRYWPQAALEAVEIDPEVIAAAGRWFALPTRRLVVHEADAATWVAQAQQRFDLIIVDVFIDDAVPEVIAAREFVIHLRRILRPGGALLLNRMIESVAGRTATSEARETFMHVFPEVEVYRRPGNEVWLVFSK